MQVATIKASRRNTLWTLETTLANTRATIQADRLRHTVDGLIDDIASYFPVSYAIDTAYNNSRLRDVPFPRNIDELREKEQVLHTRIRLRLDPFNSDDAGLIAAMDDLRDERGTSRDLWVSRRDEMVARAQRAISSRWRAILSAESTIRPLG